jgi:MATE family multidrug resistance protein
VHFFSNIKKQYKAVGGYAEFFKIAIPLIISTGISAIELLTDRTFLSHYSVASFSASAPAAMVNWAITCFFFGTVVYVSVFVAQYYGKKDFRAIGPILWQGIYLSFVSAVIIFCISLFSESFFEIVNHPDHIMHEESIFFKFLCYGAFPTIVEGALAGFYVGRGKTKIVLLVSSCGVIINILLDFCLIFGKFHLPEMGIIGAALASDISLLIVCVIYFSLIVTKKNNDIYNTRCMRINFDFIKRLFRYGIPSGAEFFFDEVGAGAFMVIVGRLGVQYITAGNVVITVYNTFYMPLVGCSITTSIMVGKYLGRNRVDLAKTSVKSAVNIAYTYVIFVIFILFFFSKSLSHPFLDNIHSQILNTNMLTASLLKIAAICLIFDTSDMIFSSAIKGAGDTLFVMKRVLFFSIFFIIVPSYFSVYLFKFGVYGAWICFLLYSIAPAISFYFRYRSKKWEKMRIYN